MPLAGARPFDAARFKPLVGMSWAVGCALATAHNGYYVKLFAEAKLLPRRHLAVRRPRLDRLPAEIEALGPLLALPHPCPGTPPPHRGERPSYTDRPARPVRNSLAGRKKNSQLFFRGF